MSGTDKTIRWSTAAAVIGVAVVAAVVSYEHAYELVHGHGETSYPDTAKRLDGPPDSKPEQEFAEAPKQEGFEELPTEDADVPEPEDRESDEEPEAVEPEPDAAEPKAEPPVEADPLLRRALDEFAAELAEGRAPRSGQSRPGST